MFEKPGIPELRQAAQQLGMNPSDDYLRAVEEITGPLARAYAALDAMPDELPPVKYPRGQAYRPQGDENRYGAWYVKTAIKGAPSGKLAGRRVALKDNVCLAGVPMMIGADILQGYVPDVDATIVERILDAGGEIAGKAVCEYYCVSGGSHTSSTGPVQNPRKPGFTTGGSSSGSAALVAASDVDMAIGGDQAGSIRIPASFCGIVGLKPTFGLVPYTGIAPLEMTLDVCGPMTATVRDNALLLEVIAGPDGIDSRQRGVAAGRLHGKRSTTASKVCASACSRKVLACTIPSRMSMRACATRRGASPTLARRSKTYRSRRTRRVFRSGRRSAATPLA